MNRLYVSMSLLVMVGLGLTLTHYTPRTLSSNYRHDRKLVTEQKWGISRSKLLTCESMATL